ncbi:hypothetical protein [Sphingomonas sp. 10B4]|uniref:hypothetical protein n=1 Tax=Sphingomonas sp. 10B4 TaxID=3048575 RepID=UPI002AB3BDC4|nr:hypothetical protein [Sphingomonas sp. 10B4]MDY7525514.1 hypothetical protein [Sphingomonas sp. 10B4]MEB0281460.1 hypothetical protein [Sphingomonas sp. 10B4]
MSFLDKPSLSAAEQAEVRAIVASVILELASLHAFGDDYPLVVIAAKLEEEAIARANLMEAGRVAKKAYAGD